jgi:hypothetical protein
MQYNTPAAVSQVVVSPVVLRLTVIGSVDERSVEKEPGEDLDWIAFSILVLGSSV